MPTQEQLEATLRAVAADWRNSQRRIGEVLNQLELGGHPVQLYYGMLREEFGMPNATAKCCKRWGRGDFGADDRAMLLMCKVPHALLSKWTRDAIETACNEEHRIISPEEGRVVVKTLARMSNREIRKNTNAQGFVPVSRQIDREPDCRYCIASEIEFDDRDIPILVSRGREVIRMQIPRRLYEQLTGMLAMM